MLSNHFLEKFSKSLGIPVKHFSQEALECIKRYHYPGNVRELENIIERTVALEPGPIILPESLPRNLLEVQEPAPGQVQAQAFEIDREKGIELERLVAEFERALLVKALEQTGGVKKKASKLLNISFRSMRYRVDKYSLGNMSIDDEDESESVSVGSA
jgi:two-component system response regulator PilR (NtrC family)